MYLVIWSATTIATERTSHLSMVARLARPIGIEVRDATPAQSRVLGVPSDFFPVVPAALALGMRAGIHADTHVWQHGADRARSLALLHRRLRSDEHEPEVVGKRFEEFAALPVGVELHLALQRGPDLPRNAQRLELLQHVRAQIAQLPPAIP